MTSIVTLPDARIPIGHAVINGNEVDVNIDIEWMRAFLDMVRRGGGTVAPSITELVSTINRVTEFRSQDGEDGQDGMPGAQGMPGTMGPMGQTIRGEDGEDGAPGMPSMSGVSGSFTTADLKTVVVVNGMVVSIT